MLNLWYGCGCGLSVQVLEWTSKRFAVLDGKTRLVPLTWYPKFSDGKDGKEKELLGYDVECGGT